MEKIDFEKRVEIYQKKLKVYTEDFLELPFEIQLRWALAFKVRCFFNGDHGVPFSIEGLFMYLDEVKEFYATVPSLN